MYFTVADKPNHNFPVHHRIGNKWLSIISQSETFGYDYDVYGGNFLKLEGDVILFSYHKDFKLKKSSDCYLTNIDIQGEELPSDIVEYNITTGSFKTYQYRDNAIASYDVVVNNIKDILLENINSSHSNQIAYSAGLDSSTLAYMSHGLRLGHTILIGDKFNYGELPFNTIRKCKFSMPEFEVDDNTFVRESFYGELDTDTITGFYGDLTVTHNSHMFYQAFDLHSNPDNIIPYDKKKNPNYIKFETREDIVNAIRYVNTHTYFRHWFEHFNIIDPYRDPRLIEEITSLPTDDLIEQIATGRIQKDIIRSFNESWLDNLCPTKNDYSNFY
jgi:hypothetical protein